MSETDTICDLIELPVLEIVRVSREYASLTSETETITEPSASLGAGRLDSDPRFGPMFVGSPWPTSCSVSSGSGASRDAGLSKSRSFDGWTAAAAPGETNFLTGFQHEKTLRPKRPSPSTTRLQMRHSRYARRISGVCTLATSVSTSRSSQQWQSTHRLRACSSPTSRTHTFTNGMPPPTSLPSPSKRIVFFTRTISSRSSRPTVLRHASRSAIDSKYRVSLQTSTSLVTSRPYANSSFLRQLATLLTPPS
mmetsp:Transcript_31941/g.81262  ORF Transcript_31941/g.81262 Transcript_31941/m.81262 type:complete len:251 (+) Transcript_31941:3957-4709(+)